MAPLEEYRRKRRRGTPEPLRGDDPAEEAPGGRFVVQEHSATRMHWDLRLERQIEKLTAREAELQAEMAANATDFARLRALQGELEAAVAERERLEDAWLELSEST